MDLCESVMGCCECVWHYGMGVWCGSLFGCSGLPVPTWEIVSTQICLSIDESGSWSFSRRPLSRWCIEGLHGQWRLIAGPWGSHRHGSMTVAIFVTVWGQISQGFWLQAPSSRWWIRWRGGSGSVGWGRGPNNCPSSFSCALSVPCPGWSVLRTWRIGQWPRHPQVGPYLGWSVLG